MLHVQMGLGKDYTWGPLIQNSASCITVSFSLGYYHLQEEINLHAEVGGCVSLKIKTLSQ